MRNACWLYSFIRSPHHGSDAQHDDIRTSLVKADQERSSRIRLPCLWCRSSSTSRLSTRPGSGFWRAHQVSTAHYVVLFASGQRRLALR